MTTSTPRIPRHRPLLRSDLADQGTTLAANDAIERDQETRGDGAGVVLVPAAVALFAIVCGALAAAFFN